MKEMHGYQLNDFLDEFLVACVDVKETDCILSAH